MLKKVVYFIIGLFLVSCLKQSNEYAKVSGLIANNDVKEISFIAKGYKKTIPVNLDGTFSDTIKIRTNGYHTFYDGKNKKSIFLSNGNNLNISYDYNNVNETMAISGIGSETSNYLLLREKFNKTEALFNYKSFYKLDKGVFDTKISYLETKINEMLSKNIDSTLRVNERTNYNRLLATLKKNYQAEHVLTTKLGIGKPSPKFYNYQNYKGGKTSLDDYKGKYVYVDVWATWCGPCKQQIPYLAKIEKEYHNKNIKFVSISTDDARRNSGSWDKAKAKWKTMIKDKKMGGIQLFADKGFQSEFIKEYGIKSIPRFLLIDPKGNIVNANAPRPSQQALKDLLDSVL